MVYYLTISGHGRGTGSNCNVCPIWFNLCFKQNLWVDSGSQKSEDWCQQRSEGSKKIIWCLTQNCSMNLFRSATTRSTRLKLSSLNFSPGWQVFLDLVSCFNIEKGVLLISLFIFSWMPLSEEWCLQWRPGLWKRHLRNWW